MCTNDIITNGEDHHDENRRHSLQQTLQSDQQQQVNKPMTTTDDNFEEQQHTGNCNFYFLSEKAVNELPNFKYAGEDRSLLYKYILSPLAQFCVNKLTPKTMAPNTITMAGLVLMIATYIIIWYYYNDLKEQDNEENHEFTPPRWIFVLHGMSMLIYQTLDNMDGKQARRTKSSSPLGLLFDHGCDAVNTMIGSAHWIISMSLFPLEDEALSIWFLIVGPMTMFYIATWEEYYTGALIMPIVNGPSEGVLGGAIVSFLSALYGPTTFWHSTSWYDTIISFLAPLLGNSNIIGSILSSPLRNCDVVILSAAIGIGQEMIIKSIYVSRKYGFKALLNILPFVTMAISTFVIGCYDVSLFTNMPRTTLHLMSGLFCESVTQLMLDHISNETFNPFHRSYLLIPLVVLMIIVVFVNNNSMDGSSTSTITYNSILYVISIDEYLLIYTSIVWAYLLTKMTLVIHEICSVLDIWCFDIVTPRIRRKQQQRANSETTSSNHGDALKSTSSESLLLEATTTSSESSSSSSSSSSSCNSILLNTTGMTEQEKRKVL